MNIWNNGGGYVESQSQMYPVASGEAAIGSWNGVPQMNGDAPYNGQPMVNAAQQQNVWGGQWSSGSPTDGQQQQQPQHQAGDGCARMNVPSNQFGRIIGGYKQ